MDSMPLVSSFHIAMVGEGLITLSNHLLCRFSSRSGGVIAYREPRQARVAPADIYRKLQDPAGSI